MKVILLGPPNSGKTTLFNWLSRNNVKTVNYPGSTVDYAVAKVKGEDGKTFEIIDTPGTYSLIPKTPEEKITYKILFDETKKIDHAIVVIDGTRLERNLLFIQQLKDTGMEITVAMTMKDILQRENKELHLKPLEDYLKLKVIPIDGQLGGGVNELIQTVPKQPLTSSKSLHKTPWNEEKLHTTSLKNREFITSLGKNEELNIQKRTQLFDQFLLHPLWGLIFFATTMALLFSSIFWLAAPLMEAVDSFFGFLITSVRETLGRSLLSQFITDGLLTGLTAVFVFVPQIFILFFGMGFLEDSGYLARAATLIDKPFSRMGMSGRSFVPLLSGFACAVPAMMAARTIGSQKERWITMFIIPLMTCSARLPVYALFLSFLFYQSSPWKPGLFLTALFFGALVAGSLVATVLNRFLKTENTKSLLMMELPLYRRPLPRVAFTGAYRRSLMYIRRAGPIIFCLSILIWVLTAFPNYREPDIAQRTQTSYMAQVGKTIEPVFKPMGVDWRVGVGLLSAFAAREVFVSTIAVIFNITEDLEEKSVRQSLIQKMKSATNSEGKPIFTVATVLGLILFVMIALQCVSTTAVAVGEMKSWKFAISQLIAFNVLAYILAVSVVQIFG